MPTAYFRGCGPLPRLSRSLTATVLAAVLLVPSLAQAQIQDTDQQGCINALLKGGAKAAKAQGKTNASCVKSSQDRQIEKLGAPGQELSTDACLTNDPKGKLAKGADKLVGTETKSCTVAPDFGSAGASRTSGAGYSGSRAVLRDIFGPNLDQLFRRLAYDDEAAAGCQASLVGGTGRLGDTLWKEATGAAKSALSGKTAPQSASASDLATAIVDALAADAKGKIADAIGELGAELAATCDVTAQPFLELMRGECVNSANAAALTTCAVSATRCRFCRSLVGATDLPLDCEDFDNGAADGTCPGFADAHEIVNAAELLEGPLADGQVGDFMMSNEKVRVVIQRAGVRDMYSVGGFGGNIIDAELVDHPGMDNFLEIQPAVNLETVINATSLEVVNDGADGGAAIIRTCGPDDLLDFVNPSTVIRDAGLNFPASADDLDQDVEGCTDYILEPDAAYVKMLTTIFNNEATTLAAYVGDYVNAAGELEQWASGDAGIGTRLTADMGVLSYYGYGEAEGVDYGITTIEIPSAGTTSFFSTSGVSYILHSQGVLDAILGDDPEFEVSAGGSKSFTRFFGIGDGSGGNSVTLENLVKARLSGEVSGCVTVDGAPAPGARVSVGPQSMGALTAVTSTWVADATGCYSGTLRVGSYGIAAWREGTMYEGGGSVPLVHTITAVAGTPATRDFDLPAPGHVSVTVIDENSAAVPARVSIVGFDPAPDDRLSDPDQTGVFRDPEDMVPFGITRAMYTNAAGAVDFDLEPGSYQVYVSRGVEYSTYSAPLTITGGATSNVAAQIARVLDTTGFISSDHHVHAISSADSRVSEADRIRQFAGEGVDNIIMTDHHSHTDLQPKIDAMGFGAFVTTIIGEEITTWDAGHYNGYPFTVDSSRPTGGSTDWGRAAPAGEDFPSLGAYIMTPAEVDTLAKSQPTATADTVVQVNHIDSHFVPMKIDTSLVPPASSLSAAGKLDFRMDPASGNLFHLFDALELWNGYNRSHQSQFLNERIGVWFNLLNQGLITTAITDTDTHKFFNLETAGGSTFSASSTDDPSSISDAEIAQSVAAGRCVGSQGIYVQTRLDDAGSAAEADLTVGGSNLLTVSNPVAGLTLEIDVQAPLFAEFDTIRIYANASTIPSPTDPAPELFSATPTMTLTAGVDFAVTTTNVYPGIPGASRREAHLSIPFTNLTEDTWFVVVVKGTDGVSRPMFPMFPPDLQTAGNTTLANLIDGNLGQSGVTALGFTNALYADVDGNPGFDAPLAP